MLQLNNLDKLNKARKRVGRGGDKGGTSGKGHKGQKARTGGLQKMGFEGGQMPLTRRLPKRGFTNIFKKEFSIINLADLESRFISGDLVNKESLIQKGLIKNNSVDVKILGNGTLSKKLTVEADGFSKSAQEAIKRAGGDFKLSKELSSGSVAS
jgi:large subunit ribosomal protein L15